MMLNNLFPAYCVLQAAGSSQCGTDFRHVCFVHKVDPLTRTPEPCCCESKQKLVKNTGRLSSRPKAALTIQSDAVSQIIFTDCMYFFWASSVYSLTCCQLMKLVTPAAISTEGQTSSGLSSSQFSVHLQLDFIRNTCSCYGGSSIRVKLCNVVEVISFFSSNIQLRVTQLKDEMFLCRSASCQ